MQRSHSCLVSVIGALALSLPAAALAQEPGVTLDKGPSSKEYAIPLDAARGATKTKAPQPKAQPAASATTPAHVATTTPKATTATKPKKHTETTTQAIAPATTTPVPPAGDAATVNTAAPASSNGVGAGVVIAGLALAVLALGGLAGLVLRRRRTPIDER